MKQQNTNFALFIKLPNLLICILFFGVCNVAFTQSRYRYTGVDYITRFDKPIYSYYDKTGTFQYNAVSKTKPGVSVNFGEQRNFQNGLSFLQECALTFHNTEYETPLKTYKHFLYTFEGKLFLGKSFFNEKLNLHTGPIFSINMSEGSIGYLDRGRDNKWFRYGAAMGIQFHYSKLFLTSRLNYYFTNADADYHNSKPIKEVEHVHINNRQFYVTVGIGLALGK